MSGLSDQDEAKCATNTSHSHHVKHLTDKQFTALQSAEKKLFWRVLLLNIALMFVNHIDRTSLSFASVELNRDLGIDKATYGLGAGLFFAAYASMQVPANMMMTRIGGPIWLGSIAMCWGAVAACFAAISNIPQFLALRFLLGFFESGAVPGMNCLAASSCHAAFMSICMACNQHAHAINTLGVTSFTVHPPATVLQPSLLLGSLWPWTELNTLSALLLACCQALADHCTRYTCPFWHVHTGMMSYLSHFYSKQRITVPLGYLMGALIVSQALGAPLAAGFLSLDGYGGLMGWQWLFLLEGKSTAGCQ